MFHKWIFREDWTSLMAYKANSCPSSPQYSFCTLDRPEPHSFASLSSFVALGIQNAEKALGRAEHSFAFPAIRDFPILTQSPYMKPIVLNKKYFPHVKNYEKIIGNGFRAI